MIILMYVRKLKIKCKELEGILNLQDNYKKVNEDLKWKIKRAKNILEG